LRGLRRADRCACSHSPVGAGSHACPPPIDGTPTVGIHALAFARRGRLPHLPATRLPGVHDGRNGHDGHRGEACTGRLRGPHTHFRVRAKPVRCRRQTDGHNGRRRQGHQQGATPPTHTHVSLFSMQAFSPVQVSTWIVECSMPNLWCRSSCRRDRNPLSSVLPSTTRWTVSAVSEVLNGQT